MNRKSPEGIEIFNHRRDPDYLKFLSERISIYGKNGLINQSIPVPEALRERTEHKKMCHLSFLGIAANNFFDQGKKILADEQPVLSEKIQDIFRYHKKFEEQGIWLRIRFLFIYPFSTHAMSIINAETTQERCNVNGEWSNPSEGDEFNVDWNKFHNSSFFRGQQQTLNKIQNWSELYDFNNERGNKTMVIRFTPISPNICALIINDIIVCDPYLLAKQSKYTDRLIYKHPVMLIEKTKRSLSSNLSYEYVLNHFQYLWQLNITLECGDATKYIRGKRKSLSEYNLPEEVLFRLKANRLLNQYQIAKQELQSWVYKTKNQFNRYVLVPKKTNEKERVFISCSWNNNLPNDIASQIENWIKIDFTNNSIPDFKPILIRGKPGQLISQLVYEGLENCELGIVFLTNDLKVLNETFDKHHTIARPNIYLELGYLMCKFNSINGKNKKLFLAIENTNSTLLPSNLNNFIYVDLNKEIEQAKTFSVYTKIIKWLYGSSALLELNINIILQVLLAHKKRIIQYNLNSEVVSKLINELNVFYEEIQ